MRVRGRGRNAAAGGALEEALADEVGFEHIFNGRHFFSGGGREGIEADGSAVEFMHNCAQKLAVRAVKSEGVYVEKPECA